MKTATNTSVYCVNLLASQRGNWIGISYTAKHKQIREELELSDEFSAEEDYRVVRKDPVTYWQFNNKRDCTQLSMMDSQQLWGSRMRPKSNVTTEVCPVRSTYT